MRRSEEAIRLAHMAVNPDTVRRLVADHGVGGALSRLRRRDTTPQVAREAAGTSAEARSRRLEQLGVEMVFDEEPRYPKWLRDLPDHPLWLFVKGTLPACPGVAVVGSRRATRYGLDLARDIGRRVGAAGWNVVSGLAAGVDTMSHVGCLDAGGATTAVLGSGIDVWYPRGNKRLGERIVASEGCVVSEFPPGTIPEPWRFPSRNRIISGLAEVVIVVEAAVRSGALITARLAVEQGRFVMAVPGDLARVTSEGANLLIRDGAHPLTDLSALIEELALVMGPAPASQSADAAPGTADHLLEILAAESLTIEELVNVCDMPMAEVVTRIATLEVEGMVVMREGRIASA